MLVKTYAAAVYGVDARRIDVEIHTGGNVGPNKQFYNLVGLPDNAIRESNYRIAAALQNNGYRIPGKKLILNMSPADLRKEGAAYDLPLAIGILAASGQIQTQFPLNDYVIMGELSLDGCLQPIRGALPIAIQAQESGFKGIILPQQKNIKPPFVH